MQPIQPGDRIVYDIWFWVKSILISGGGAGAIIGWWLYNREKKRIPVHAHEVKKELEEHKKDDDGRFDTVKGLISDSENRVVDALRENVRYIREDIKVYQASTDKRFEFLEKVFLDERLGGK